MNLREWLFSIVVAALAVALVQSLTPEGTVKKLGSLAGGMILLLVMLRPVARLEPTALTAAFEFSETEMSDVWTERTKTIIEEKASAYIVDKGAELGVSCTARVTARKDENGWAIPWEAEIEGVWSRSEQTALSRIVAEELAIPEERQYWEVSP